MLQRATILSGFDRFDVNNVCILKRATAYGALFYDDTIML